MYRIHFDHRIGRFVVQVSTFGGLWWSSVKTGEGDGYAFDTFNEAQSHISSIGLDKLYENKSADQYRNHMMQHRGAL